MSQSKSSSKSSIVQTNILQFQQNSQIFNLQSQLQDQSIQKYRLEVQLQDQSKKKQYPKPSPQLSRNNIKSQVIKILQPIFQQDSKIKSIINQIFTIQSYGEKQHQLKQKIKDQTKIKQNLQKQVISLNNQLILKQASLKGINQAKLNIKKFINQNNQYTYKNTKLQKPQLSQDPQIKKPDQKLQKKYQTVNQKLKKFFQDRIELKKQSVSNLQREIQQMKKQIGYLTEQKETIIQSRRSQRLKQEENEKRKKIQNMKKYVSDLKEYIKKNRQKVKQIN